MQGYLGAAPMSIANATVNTSNAGAVTGSTVSVTVSYTYDPFIGFYTRFFNLTISSTSNGVITRGDNNIDSDAEGSKAVRRSLPVALSMSIFLLGSLGCHYRRIAHVRAQRAVTRRRPTLPRKPSMLSVYNGTSGAWGTYAGAKTAGTAIACSASGMSTSAAACGIAAGINNGFGLRHGHRQACARSQRQCLGQSPTSADPGPAFW